MVAKGSRYVAASSSSNKHQILSAAVKYAPWGDHCDVANMLRKGCWRARDVLNFTVQAFYKRYEEDRLSDWQNDARAHFIDDYKKQWMDFDGRPLRDEPAVPTYSEILDGFRILLDKYYFFGTLCDYRLDVHVYNTFNGDDCVPGESWRDRKLYIPISNRKTVFDLHECIAILLHEMTHLYLQLTVCKCSDCSEGMLSNVGAPDDQHGPIFQMLHRLILSDLRSWHDQLAKFDDDDCPDKSISEYSLESHEAACEDSKTNWKYRYNSGAHKKHWIAMEEEDDIISVRVRRPLRDAHKAAEEMIRKKDAKARKSAKRAANADSKEKHDSDVESDVAADDYRYGGGSSKSRDKGKGKDEDKPESSKKTKTTKGKKKVRINDQVEERSDEDTLNSSTTEGDESIGDGKHGEPSESSGNNN